MAKKKTRKRVRGGASYPCPKCGHPSHVVITRRDEERNVGRVRQCRTCDHQFRTVEMIVGKK